MDREKIKIKEGWGREQNFLMPLIGGVSSNKQRHLELLNSHRNHMVRPIPEDQQHYTDTTHSIRSLHLSHEFQSPSIAN